MSVNLTRNELLVKLGLAKAKWRARRRLVDVKVDAKLAAFCFTPDRLPTTGLFSTTLQ
jgi:hypothetical protein